MPEQAVARDQSMLPAWTLLEQESLWALLSRDGSLPQAIHVTPEACPAEIVSAPIMSAARLMIERAVANGGLSLTARGALSRADTGALFEATTWPDFSKEAVRAACKVLNEADVLPINFTRLLVQEAGLLRRRKGLLLATKLGKQLLDPDQAPALFSRLFEIAFWRMNLGYFDRVPVDYWPQTHIGVVLWCLSVTAHTWVKSEILVPACTIPDETLVGVPSYYPDFMLDARVLRPLTWFGLMDTMQPPGKAGLGHPWQYRKSALFDRVLGFQVDLMRPSGRLQ